MKLAGRICQISLGCCYSLKLDQANDVYTIGDSRRGELTEKERFTWKKVAGLDGKRVIKIQCGHACSAILTDDGVYAMGNDLFGDGRRNMATKIELPDVIDISLTFAHILAMTTTGQVFAWGRNRFLDSGTCGVGTSSIVDKPTRVSFPDDVTVVEISAGHLHSIFTCKKK